jgi:nanoRNase/pAp phosphatase (c-di-AMP/oligoRNAs hydrolase)
MAGRDGVAKSDFPKLALKKRTASSFVRTLEERDGFLIVGHRSPDEDCVAAMVAFGLIAVKLNKSAYLHFGAPVHSQFEYLLRICTYNSISILGPEDAMPGHVGAVVALDTPKPAMLDLGPSALRLLDEERPLRMEIDHHLGADSSYFGDEGYRLVAAASSASELVGYLALKMDEDEELKARWQIGEFLTRNLVLAVLTGIIGDSRMGRYLKSDRERWYYERFSAIFDRMLAQKTRLGSGNFTSKEQVFDAITALSTDAENCYEAMMARRRASNSIGYALLDAAEVGRLRGAYGDETMTAVAKTVADALAEESGKLGLLAYPDHPDISDLVQFRVRRSQSYQGIDLRDMLARLAIENGGGHPGAVGFRFPKAEVPDLESFAAGVVERIEAFVRETDARP